MIVPLPQQSTRYLFTLLALLTAQCSCGFVPSVVNVARTSISPSSIIVAPQASMQVWWEGGSDVDVDDDDREAQLPEAPDVWIRKDSFNRQQNIRNVPDASTSTTGLFYQDGSLLKDAATNQTVGVKILLEDATGQEQAMAALGSVEWILLSSSPQSSSWQMIPAENLIAAAQSTGTRLAFCVDKASDVAGLSRALELGVDALCINGATATPELCKSVFQARKDRNDEEKRNDDVEETLLVPSHAIVLGDAWRRDTEATILADRVCVDLVQTLSPEEGCWIGSSAKLMALVLSEAVASQFVPTRPFRVNAGPVHSYILLADEQTTKYLCELQPADQVLVYNSQTRTNRAVAVGRLKQEIRPCVLVELIVELEESSSSSSSSALPQHQTGQIFLQQAETVRLGQEDGVFIRVTDLEAQREKDTTVPLLLRVANTGTHIGKAYTGKVEER
jgi:3-dehydroquinate synthase II